ncbi:MAG: extensin family protein, partial [Rhizobiales bacterium]|nr:extensin family protein [Hyphomicrobiales bacterium]
MRRGVVLYLVGSSALLALVGCSRGWLQEREPWRREAELACVKSGVVKPSAMITPAKAINGPGVCGADYPFKVAALGEGTALSFTNDLRPPQGIPQALRAMPASSYPQQTYGSARPDRYGPQAGVADNGPMSLHPEGEPEEDEEPETPGLDPYAVSGAKPLARPGYSAASGGYQQSRAAPQMAPQQNEYPLPPLGPQREAAPMSIATAIAPNPTLACPMISALDHWIAESIQPAAQRWFGQAVVEIKQISAYSCRGMNGQRGAPISEHAFGNALDVAGFVLADGRRITVKGGWRGAPEEQGFLRDIQAAACGRFSTVLAPGSNIYHYDHIHVDLRRRRGDKGICKPAAVSGELVAERARGGGGRLGFAAEKYLPDFGITDDKLPR